MLNAEEDVEQQEFSFVASRNAKWYTASLEDSFAVSYKVIHLLHGWAIEYLGFYPNKLKIYVHLKTCTWIFFHSVIHNCQNFEVTKVSFSRWFDQLWPYIGILFSNKKTSYQATQRNSNRIQWCPCDEKTDLWIWGVLLVRIFRVWYRKGRKYMEKKEVTVRELRKSADLPKSLPSAAQKSTLEI